MRTLSYHLILVNSSLRVLTEQVEQLSKCLEQERAGSPSSVSGCNPPSVLRRGMHTRGSTHSVKGRNMQKSSFAAASVDKSSLAETTTGKPKIYKNLKPENKLILDLVYDRIKRTRKGIAHKQIQEKTGLNRQQVANAIYKLKSRNMIEVKKRGVYVKKSG